MLRSSKLHTEMFVPLTVALPLANGMFGSVQYVIQMSNCLVDNGENDGYTTLYSEMLLKMAS